MAPTVLADLEALEDLASALATSRGALEDLGEGARLDAGDLGHVFGLNEP